MENINILKTQIYRFLQTNPKSSMEAISKALQGKVSERTLARTIDSIESVVKIGRKASRVYATSKPINNIYKQQIIKTNEVGHTETIAHLYILSDNTFFVKTLNLEYSWLTIGSDKTHSGLFKTLPWYLSSMRPNGYLGRMWAREYGKVFSISENVHNWRDSDVVEANIIMNLDVSGNLQLNKENPESLFQQVISVKDKLNAYDKIVETLESGQMVGSSVDGEQQKFSVKIQEYDGTEKLVLIKTNNGARPDIKERQADLLIMEHVSGEVLRKHGWEVPKTEILKSKYFIYLESERFDRTQEGGKKGFVSLRSLCEATYFTGKQSEWIEALQHLNKLGFVSKDELSKGTELTIIGRLIENKDMHLGNLSLWLPKSHSKDFFLAPVYDMTSMQWTPSLVGYVPLLYVFKDIPEASLKLTQIAKEIWEASSMHPYISEDWKLFAIKKVERFDEKLKTMFDEKIVKPSINSKLKF